MSDVVHTIEDWIELLRERTHEHGKALSKHEGVQLAEAIRREAIAEVVGRHETDLGGLRRLRDGIYGVLAVAAVAGPAVVAHYWK